MEVNEYSHIATITFDDEKTTLQQIIDALNNAGFPIDGPPKFLN